MNPGEFQGMIAIIIINLPDLPLRINDTSPTGISLIKMRSRKNATWPRNPRLEDVYLFGNDMITKSSATTHPAPCSPLVSGAPPHDFHIFDMCLKPSNAVALSWYNSRLVESVPKPLQIPLPS